MAEKNQLNTQALLFDLLFLIQEKMKSIVKNADADLSPLQVLILRTLVKNGELTQNELGKKLGKDKAQITRLIHELVDKSLLKKERNLNDKRSFIISATPSVHNKVKHFIYHEKNLIETMLKGSSEEEKKQFKKMLKHMIINIKKGDNTK